MSDMTSFLNSGLICLVLAHVVPEGDAGHWSLISSIALLAYLVTMLLGLVSWVLARKLAAIQNNTSFFAELWRGFRGASQ